MPIVDGKPARNDGMQAPEFIDGRLTEVFIKINSIYKWI